MGSSQSDEAFSPKSFVKYHGYAVERAQILLVSGLTLHPMNSKPKVETFYDSTAIDCVLFHSNATETVAADQL